MRPEQSAVEAGPSVRRRLGLTTTIQSRLTPTVVLVIILGVAGIVILWAGRGIVFIADEWRWISDALHVTPNAILRDDNGHLFALPFGIYDALTATIGLAHYWVFRALALALHLTIAGLVYLLARRGLGSWAALVPTAVVAFLGTGAEAFVSAINIGPLSATAACLGALLTLSRRTPRGDLATCGLLVLGLASFTTAVAFTAGVFVEVLWRRDRWRRIWVPLVPTLLYVAWRLHYGGALSADIGSNSASPDVVDVVRGGVKAATGAFAGLAGVQLENPTLHRHLPWLGQAFQVLTVAGAALLAFVIARTRRLSARLANVIVVALGFWLLIGVGRGIRGDLYASRYVYSGAIAVVLIIVEAVSLYGLPRSRWRRLIPLAVAGIVAVNVVWMVVLANHIRDESTMVRARLAALDVVGPSMPPSFSPSGEFAFHNISAGSYFAARRRFDSSPAYSAAELRGASEEARQAADDVLVRAYGLRLVPGGVAADGPPPALERVAGGSATSRGSCLVLMPAGAPAAAEVTPRSPSGIALDAAHGVQPAVAVRRFGGRYRGVPSAGGGATASLALPPGHAGAPWHVQVVAPGRTLVCSGS